MRDYDAQAEALAEFVRRDPNRCEFENGFQPWPESDKQKARAAQKRGPACLTLRLPRYLHEQARRSAACDGMSLNVFFVHAIARQIGDELGYGRGREQH